MRNLSTACYTSQFYDIIFNYLNRSRKNLAIESEEVMNVYIGQVRSKVGRTKRVIPIRFEFGGTLNQIEINWSLENNKSIIFKMLYHLACSHNYRSLMAKFENYETNIPELFESEILVKIDGLKILDNGNLELTMREINPDFIEFKQKSIDEINKFLSKLPERHTFNPETDARLDNFDWKENSVTRENIEEMLEYIKVVKNSPIFEPFKRPRLSIRTIESAISVPLILSGDHKYRDPLIQFERVLASVLSYDHNIIKIIPAIEKDSLTVDTDFRTVNPFAFQLIYDDGRYAYQAMADYDRSEYLCDYYASKSSGGYTGD